VSRLMLYVPVESHGLMLIAVNWGWVFSDAGTDSFSLSDGTTGEDAWVGDNDRELYFLD